MFDKEESRGSNTSKTFSDLSQTRKIGSGAANSSTKRKGTVFIKPEELPIDDYNEELDKS